MIVPRSPNRPPHSATRAAGSPRATKSSCPKARVSGLIKAGVFEEPVRKSSRRTTKK